MADKEFDWIDDAFDEKKTAEDMEKAKGPKAAGCLFVIVLLVVIGLIGFSFFGIIGALSSL